MRCRKTEQVLCRYLKPLGKNINLMIWCLCNHQSDLNYDKMVVLLDSIYCIKVVLKLHSSNITPKLLKENSYPAGRRRHLKSRILWPSPKTYFSLICNFAFVNMDCVVVWKIQAFTFFLSVVKQVQFPNCQAVVHTLHNYIIQTKISVDDIFTQTVRGQLHSFAFTSSLAALWKCFEFFWMGLLESNMTSLVLIVWNRRAMKISCDCEFSEEWMTRLSST